MMAGLLLAGACAATIWFLSETQAAITPPSLPVVFVLGLGAVGAFKIGRRVGHRDTGKGLFHLYIARRWLGRTH
jgi:hypothetical protein